MTQFGQRYLPVVMVLLAVVTCVLGYAAGVKVGKQQQEAQDERTHIEYRVRDNGRVRAVDIYAPELRLDTVYSDSLYFSISKGRKGPNIEKTWAGYLPVK